MSDQYRAGRRLEYKCIQELRRRGFSAQRTAGSRGPFDVVAWTNRNVHFIQVKKATTLARLKAARRDARTAWAYATQPWIPGLHIELWAWHNKGWIVYDLKTRPLEEVPR